MKRHDANFINEDEEIIELNPKNYKLQPTGIEVERVGDKILIEGIHQFEEKSENFSRDIENNAKITSLDCIQKYSNIFICVQPFIFHGYRIHHNLKDCIFSLFTFHNESLNIWTHFIPFIAFLFIFINQMTEQQQVLKNANVVYLYLFTSSLLFLFSSIHHTFSCHSNEVWNCCYKLDLIGIIFQLISATICTTNFMFHDFEELRKNYTIVFLFIGVITAGLSLFDFFVSAKMNMFVMFLYASLFLLSFSSSIHWIAIGDIEEIDKMSGYLLVGFVFLFSGFILFMAKFPECIFQHKIIDYFLQSHILWHICCVCSSVSFYLLFYNYNLLLKFKK